MLVQTCHEGEEPGEVVIRLRKQDILKVCSVHSIHSVYSTYNMKPVYAELCCLCVDEDQYTCIVFAQMLKVVIHMGIHALWQAGLQDQEDVQTLPGGRIIAT